MTYRWLNDLSQQFLDRGYLLPGQSVDDRVNIICNTAEKLLNKPGYGARLKENFQKGWYSFSTPIWSNFGTSRGLGISCYSGIADDSIDSILYTAAEVGVMSKYGGGTGVYLGKVRPRGSDIKDNGQSFGSVHFAQLFDKTTSIVSQGSSRRGSCVVYQDIDHPDIEEFLTIRSEGSPIQDLSFGVCVPDYWLEEMIAGDAKKRRIWAKVLECRTNIGYPYITFIDNANNYTVDVYKDKQLRILHSNLCNEIYLYTDTTQSFVCDLSSMNILYYDEWKNTDAVEILVYLLDAVMTDFIEKGKHIRFLERAVKFAENQRALGIGWLGWHSYLQSKMIPWESMEAQYLNMEIARSIQENAWNASRRLADEYGEPELLRGYGRRNTTLTAIAPTKSSSFIIGQVSEGIEPDRTNYQIKDLQKGKYTIKNRYLEKILADRDQDTDETWSSILKNGGSVQHLKCLDEYEKKVFKTFSEISPKEIVIQAAQRQKYIDQGQSLNIMIHPSTPTKDVNALLLEGWRLGIKGFYYQHSVNAAQAFHRNILHCASCEA